MHKRPFSTSPSYVQSIQGLLRLHELTLKGEDESPEAEAARDSLERPWTGLSEVEQKRITGLSEDLYSISNPSGEPISTNPQAKRKLSEAIEAGQSGEWDTALELLRRWGKYLEPAMLSYHRGTVWQGAGDNQTASLFYQHATQLDPSNERFKAMHLVTLVETDPDAALERADDILATDQSFQPLVVAQAASVRACSVLTMSREDARLVLERLTKVLERTLRRLRDDQGGQCLDLEFTHSSVTALLGSCYQQLGDFQAALRSFNAGLAVDPKNADLLVARGTLCYGVDANSQDDFEQAMRIDPTQVWPYFFLAHHYLVNNRFGECGKMCERALELPASDEVRANLNEWLAISEAELGVPPERIRSAFEAAIQLAPNDDRIRRNLEVFDKGSVDQRRSQLPWEKLNGSVVQQVGWQGQVSATFSQNSPLLTQPAA